MAKKEKTTIPQNVKLKRLAKNIKEQAGEEALVVVFASAEKYEQADAAAKAAWVENAVEHLARVTSDEQCIRILQACGLECCSQKHSDQAADLKKKSASFKEFIAKLNAKSPLKLFLEEDGSLMVEYARCYCPLVNKASKPFKSTIYCNCSGGYLKKFLEPALGKFIRVKVIQSVISGGPSCRFQIIST
jgi:hypothetical protein